MNDQQNQSPGGELTSPPGGEPTSPPGGEPTSPTGGEPVCTAVTADGAPRENVLFAPPCTCANCAPDLNAFSGDRSDTWLRMSGSRQRLRVENVVLSPAGKALLG